MSQYASVSDLHVHGAPSAAFGSLTSGDKDDALQSASAELDAAIASQGTIPLVAISADLVSKICHIATYELMCRVGFNPGAGADQNYFLRANGPNGAREYFKRIARGEVHPAVTFTAARSSYAQPRVRSTPRRGW